jgi:hypothetical protein
MRPSPSIQRAFRCPECSTFLVDGRVVEKRSVETPPPRIAPPEDDPKAS